MPQTPRRYYELIDEFPLRPIRSERQLDEATELAFRLARQKRLNRDESDYLDVLSRLIGDYEEKHQAIDECTDGLASLRFLIEENGLTLTSLAAATGIRVSTLSEILNGRRDLNLTHIRRLAAHFRVAPGLFVGQVTN
jgi:HTH-type transcriptional regulator / antitoxin HigA